MAALDITALYERYFYEVVRWARALGAPAAELEDVAQEVFVVAGRKLESFDGGKPAAWLYRITQLTIRRNRARPWYKYLFSSRRQDVEADTFEWVGGGPEESLQRKEAQALVQRLLGRLSEKRRTVFVLYELEGYSGEQMAQFLDIPLATVWTRLFHARKEFFALVEAEKVGA